MSIDLKEIFNEKNQDLFFNKLIMDIENNIDTFKLSTKNIVKIEIAKLLSLLRRLYYKYSISIDEDSLKEILGKSKNIILKDVNELIDKKCERNQEFIKNTDRNQPSNIKYIKSYHKHINDVEKSFEEDLKFSIRKTSGEEILSKIVALKPCINEEMHQEIQKIIDVDFPSILISRITDESIHRNRTLKNISEETYRWYSNLNKMSSKIESSSNKKKLKNK